MAYFIEGVRNNEFWLDAGSAARQWPGAEPLLRAALGRIPNLRVFAKSRQPREGIEEVAAEEVVAGAEAWMM